MDIKDCYAQGTWVEETNIYKIKRVKLDDDKCIFIRQGNAPFPIVGILKSQSNEKTKSKKSVRKPTW